VRDYQFLLPITCLFWREVVGFDPFVFICGNWGENERGRIAEGALEYLGVERCTLPPLEGFGDATLAQNCRQHAAVLPFPNEAWLMTSDADLWPLQRTWYYQHEAERKDVYCYYANGDHYSSFPTCHVAARACTWRRAYGLDSTQEFDVTGAVGRSLREWVPWKLAQLREGKSALANDLNFVTWMSDQWMMTDKLRALPGFEGRVQYIERVGHPPVDRIDRGVWPDHPEMLVELVTTKRALDTHVLRPADQPGNWERVWPLIKQCLPKHADWIEHYRTRYVKSYEG
jgi:hypothetical protein